MLQGIFLYLMLSICVPYYAAAQVSLFQNMTTRDGLPSNYVFAACEDGDGYLWIGTDKGLARYDGFSWNVFTTETGLPGNYITAIFKAGDDGLWLQISAKGVFHYHIPTRKATFIAYDMLDHFLQTDEQDNLFFYNRMQNGKFSFRWVNASDPSVIHELPHSPQGGNGYSVFADFPTRTLVYVPVSVFVPSATAKVPEYEGWKADTLRGMLDEPFLYKKAAPHILVSLTSLYYFHPDGTTEKKQLFDASNTYLNTLFYKDEVVVWNEKDGLYFVNEKGITRHFTEKDGLSSNMVTAVYVLKNGRLLICTLGGGLSYKMPEGNAIVHTGNAPVKGLALSGQHVYAATDNSLLRFDLQENKTFSMPIPEKSVQSVDIWGKDIWISSLSGMTLYNENNSSLLKKTTIPVGAGISSVIQTGGKIYAGSYGTHVLEVKGNKFIEDATTPYVSERIQSISGGYVSYNYEDGVQFSFNDGKKINLSVKEGLPSGAVYHVHEYKDTFWISTGKGVALFTKGSVVRTYTKADGINGNKCIYTFHDNTGNAWVLTDKYLGKLANNKVITYLSLPVRDGYNDNVHKAVYDPSHNTLITGTLRNIYLSRLDNISMSTVIESPSLHHSILNGRVLTDTAFQIPLDYQELTFEFKPLLINPFGKAVIWYKLEGYDEQFTELKDSLRVHFSKLRSGRYTLVARAVNEDGAVSSEVPLCTFIVKRPFWQNGWFISLLLAGTGLLAYSLTKRYYKRKQRQKEKERSMQEQLERERERISRELHDNLGSSLVTIIAQSDNIETKLRFNQPEEALKKVLALSDQSREAMNILRETIWAVQGHSHSYESFVNRIRDFLQRTYAVTNTGFVCEASGSLDKELSPEQTLHLFRCIQESTQNIIKHAGASMATYQLSAAGVHLTLRIHDNGNGFDTAGAAQGNGLSNLRTRIQELKGDFRITSSATEGTIIIIETNL